MTFFVGDTVRITAELTNSTTGELVNPGAVRFKIKSPAQVLNTYTYGVESEVSRSDRGKYHVDVKVTNAGRWLWRIEVEGVVDGVDEGALQVTASQF